ncbi:MAG: hypothetical protein WAM30_08815 [Candidatus Dormiibacterota bacterium]
MTPLTAKLAAALFAGVVAIAAGAYVSGHLRNQQAPLRPPAAAQTGLGTAGAGVHPANVAPVTSTYAS